MIPMFTTFVASILGVVLTLGQRTIARIAYDGAQPRDLTDEERAMFGRMFGDVETIPVAARHVFVGVCGGRGGKSYVLGALRLLHLALTVSLATLAPGEVAAAVIVAPDLRLARQTLRYVLGAARSVPSIAKRITSETADGFTLRRPDGGSVEIVCLPATRGGSALRGRSLVCALLDEAAFFRDESSVVNDVEILRAVGPRILPGGQVLILSTPWLEQGILFDLWKTNHGAPSSAVVAHAPTLLLRDDEETRLYVERETANDPDSAACELGAEFRGGGAGFFFDPVSISQAVDPARPLVAPCPKGARRSAAADIGLIKDSSALVVGAHLGKYFEILEMLELRPTSSAPLRLSFVIGEIATVLKRHFLAMFVTDAYAREPAKEWARPLGITIKAAPEGAEAKVDSYLGLQQALRENRVRLPNHPRLLAQLRLVLARPLPGGGMKIEMPRRAGLGHGDLVSALVLSHASAGGNAMMAALRESTARDRGQVYDPQSRSTSTSVVALRIPTPTCRPTNASTGRLALLRSSSSCAPTSSASQPSSARPARARYRSPLRRRARFRD